MKLITLLAITLISSVFHGQSVISTKSYREELGLKGKVSYMEEVKHKTEDASGSLQWGFEWDKNTYRFDKKGNLLEEGSYAGEKLRYNRIYTYDNSGNKLTCESYDQEGLKSATVYHYDVTGKNMIGETRSYKDGSVFMKIKNNYDPKGKLTDQIIYKSDGSIRSKCIYTYDDKGNLLEETENNAQGNLEVKWLSTYDDKGNRIQFHTIPTQMALTIYTRMTLLL